ncbi:MAG: hypothetical protein KGN76_09285 [Acidobacteriota bacterium]|nr:hypothetical protein [Acidobacteriota bacterium]
MRTRGRTGWTVALLVLLSAPASHAAEKAAGTPQGRSTETATVAGESSGPVTVGMEVKAASAYVWRGFVPTPAFSLEPEPWIRIGEVTVSSMTDLARPDGSMLVDEHDLTVDYSHRAGPVRLSGGWINYVFPQETENRHSDELYAAVALSSYLHPTLRVFEDVHAGKGTYVNLAVSHEYELARDWAVTPSLAVGYNRHYWIDASTFSDANVGVTLTVPTPVPGLRLAPFLNYSRSLNLDYTPNRFYGGLGLVIGPERDAER